MANLDMYAQLCGIPGLNCDPGFLSGGGRGEHLPPLEFGLPPLEFGLPP